MYQYFVENPMVAGVFMLLVLGAGILLLIRIIQSIGIEKIRETVYRAFLHAEHSFKHSESDLKFEYVVNVAKKAIPPPYNLFITETMLRDVIQLWFDLIKDLLDDGKLNGTGKDDEL